MNVPLIKLMENVDLNVNVMMHVLLALYYDLLSLTWLMQFYVSYVLVLFIDEKEEW